MASQVSNARFSPADSDVLGQLGLLADLIGTWEGNGFNLIARPDFADGANLYLQLNQTHETLKVHAIGSPIPNRGFGQTDISLFGLHYLQEISDAATGSAMHFEPGLWVTQPATSYPNQDAPAGQQMVTRMGSIPHGNAILAQGTAATFTGTPILASGATPYAFSTWPSFNSTPFPVPTGGAPFTINAATTSEQANAAAIGKPPFQQYDLTVAAGPANPRSPFNTFPPDPSLPDPLRNVPLQTIVNDPIALLQKIVSDQVAVGHHFEGTVINIATEAKINFLTTPNAPTGASLPVSVYSGQGGIENITFLQGGDPTTGAAGPNADTALIYATFWIEKLSHATIPQFVQLQYAQMVVLDFAIFAVLNPAGGTPLSGNLVELGWPHITVGTLRKPFG
jgi:hypothetical protein